MGTLELTKRNGPGFDFVSSYHFSAGSHQRQTPLRSSSVTPLIPASFYDYKLILLEQQVWRWPLSVAA